MKHALKSSTENMHGLLECEFASYANLLRQRYPERIIRNATVFESAICEFSRLGYIQLVDARREIPSDLPEFLVRTIKRMKRQPVWVPGPTPGRQSRHLRSDETIHKRKRSDVAAHSGQTAADVEEKVKGHAITIHPAVERFWGRPLSNPIDLEICRVLGWTRLAGKGRAKCWRLTAATQFYDGQIYRKGALPARGQLKVDEAVYDFLNRYQRRDLDPFLTRSEFRLRLMLTLVALEIDGFAVRRIDKNGTIYFNATELLSKFLLYHTDDDDDRGGHIPPVVRVNGELLWDCVDAEDEVAHVTPRH
jgi:hypothetical protein